MRLAPCAMRKGAWGREQQGAKSSGQLAGGSRQRTAGSGHLAAGSQGESVESTQSLEPPVQALKDSMDATDSITQSALADVPTSRRGEAKSTRRRGDSWISPSDAHTTRLYDQEISDDIVFVEGGNPAG